MTTYTTEQYAVAAMLVPEYVRFDQECKLYCVHDAQKEADFGHFWYRNWQPLADTEAGRSDALVLLVAVQTWLEDNGLTDEILRQHMGILNALGSGDIEQLQHATFAAAVAIGKHIKGE